MSCSPGYFFNGTECEPCPDGTYNTGSLPSCQPHTDCEATFKRMILEFGNAMRDYVCGNCQPHHVDPEYTTATDQSKTICIPCQDATPEARAHYPPEWCQDMVPKDMLTQSQTNFNVATAFAVIFAVLLLLTAFTMLYKKYKTPPYSRQESRTPEATTLSDSVTVHSNGEVYTPVTQG